jgi:NAD dependent epimerase/dehydratase family enzyme
VLVRTSLVHEKSGGLLGPLLPLFKAGLGGRLGSGRQHMALVSMTDWLRAVTFLLEKPDATGPYNVVMPADVTNAQLTDALGDALHRPTVMVAPAFALRTVLGGLAKDLLGSIRLQPGRLRDAGFEFEHPDLESALRSALA